MPTRGRSPAPSLPPVSDEATIPLSDLLKTGFDPATLDVTTQLANRSIFVASDGTRYRLERISDPPPARDRVPTSKTISPSYPPLAAAAAATAAAHPPASYTPSVPCSGSPASIPPPHSHVQVSSDTNPSWGRSPSNASSYSRSSGAYSTRSAYTGAALPGSSPTHEVAEMMAQLSINNGFSATPLYGESDGGVQAAETLTDPDVALRLPMSPANLDALSTSPRASYTHSPYPSHDHEASWGPHNYLSPGPAPQYWTKVDYPGYVTRTMDLLEDSRKKATATTGLPSLLEDATAMTPPHRPSDPVSTPLAFPPASPDKEVREGQGTGNGYYCYPLHPSVSAPPLLVAPQRGGVNPTPGDIDTLTPVVVHHHHHHAHSTASDGASTGRDNVLPGEDLLFDGPVKSAQTLISPVFRDGILKVFRNTLNNDLRFYCKVDRESETYWMKANNAQLVPAYAYDQRLSYVVYIRDKESDKGNGYMQASQGNSRPSGIYQFSGLKELFDFQEKLTGERVVLDIGSVRMVTLSKANSRSSTQYSSARLQIWYEAEGRKSAQSDVASFVTAGTALSGPLRERLVASSSKLMLYLGRTGEYITCFSMFPVLGKL
ncbi:hypothetical protein C7999DRAFT_39292 [Corynascus novoguineensis]|uniref:Uncharacterized protein n=1 Tax=Corynascus novoguineensis TaxID=1126955 RepID=A0AAN7CWH8_9PEZI|nr:hypothetical protein C7999DRAFT_39292 [Corynascus novoguineensis]